jgi:hypothetical protein
LDGRDQHAKMGVGFQMFVAALRFVERSSGQIAGNAEKSRDEYHHVIQETPPDPFRVVYDSNETALNNSRRMGLESTNLS